MIVKISSHGFLAEVTEIPWRVGQYCIAAFEIPDFEGEVTERVRSIKNYERFAKMSEPPVYIKLVELHFTGLSSEHATAINKYVMRMAIEALQTD